jgi:two-component system response regulator AtoC
MPTVPIPPSLKDLFLHYQWPGNVRELENMIRKFLVFGEARPIEQELRQKLQRKPVNGSTLAGPAMVGETPQAGYPAIPPNGDLTNAPRTAPVLEQVASAKRDAERTAIVSALKSTNWNRKQASLLLQIDYKALLYKMNRLSIKKEKAAPPLIPARIEAPLAAAQSLPAYSGEVSVAFRRN